MYGKIIYNEENDDNIINEEFTMTSDDNKVFKKTTKYLKNNVKFSLDILPIILIELKTDARKVLTYILTHLKYNTTVITIDRKDVLKYLDSKDPAVVSNGIKMLLEQNIIEKLEGKDTYNVPINYLVRGNVNTMVSQVEKEKKEKELRDRENKCIESYKVLSDKHKLKIKIKNGNTESKN